MLPFVAFQIGLAKASASVFSDVFSPRQLFLAPRDLRRYIHAIGQIAPVGVLGQPQQLLDFAFSCTSIRFACP